MPVCGIDTSRGAVPRVTVSQLVTMLLPKWMAAHGARRLIGMVENTTAVIGIELLAATQGCDFHAPLASSNALEAVRKLVRAEVPHLDNDRHFHPDMEKAIAMVRSGATVKAAGAVTLPSISGA